MLSISIVTFKPDTEILKKLLRSLVIAIKQLPNGYSIDEIILIDNSNLELQSSPDINIVAFDLPKIKYLRNSSNLGYGAAHNIALKKCKSRYHLILNPDVILSDDCLLKALEFMDQNEDVVALSPYAEDEKGEILYLTKQYPSLLDFFLRMLPGFFTKILFQNRMRKYENRKIIDQGLVEEVSIISGCYMLCRREAVKKAGYFDEKYFLYFEDFALSLELNKQGKLVYHPAVKIIHYGGKASRKGLRHIGYFVRSAFRFFNTYGWKLI